MTALNYLILFCALAICSLVAVSIANEKERRVKAIRHQLRTLKRRVELLEELVIEVDLLVESRDITKHINDEIINLLDSMLQLDSRASYLYASLANAENRGTAFSSHSTPKTLKRLQENDADIAKARLYLTEAGRTLKHQQNTGKITLEEVQRLLQELNWAYLMVEVITHIAQGHRAINRNDTPHAHGFYKRAQNALLQSTHPDLRRLSMIDEINEILKGTRSALSFDLMPEHQYNPEENKYFDPTSTKKKPDKHE